MHEVVEPPGEELIHPLGEDELSVHEEERPEDAAGEDTNGECCGGEKKIPRPDKTRGEVGEERDREINALKNHVEEGKVLVLSTELPILFLNLFGNVNLIESIVNSEGKTRGTKKMEKRKISRISPHDFSEINHAMINMLFISHNPR